jgi:hypothetical protein
MVDEGVIVRVDGFELVDLSADLGHFHMNAYSCSVGVERSFPAPRKNAVRRLRVVPTHVPFQLGFLL